MNSTELNTFLQQAICCAGNKAKQVADMFLQGNKCAKSELKKLAVLVDSIKALDCYRAPLEEEVCTVVEGDPLTDPIEAVFTFTFPCNENMAIPSAFFFETFGSGSEIFIPGNADVINPNTIYNFETYIASVLPAGYSYTSTSADGCDTNNQFIITAPCDITSMQFTYFIEGDLESTTITATEVQAGICNATSIECETTTTEYTNCLTETEADNLVNMITKICDTCNCN